MCPSGARTSKPASLEHQQIEGWGYFVFPQSQANFGMDVAAGFRDQRNASKL
jgi:hypothetical protein